MYPNWRILRESDLLIVAKIAKGVASGERQRLVKIVFDLQVVAAHALSRVQQIRLLRDARLPAWLRNLVVEAVILDR